MPQHLWHAIGNDRRFCDACEVRQVKTRGQWEPEVSSICPGDARDTSNLCRPRPRTDGPLVKQIDPT
jgi:hypothetical protein